MNDGWPGKYLPHMSKKEFLTQIRKEIAACWAVNGQSIGPDTEWLTRRAAVYKRDNHTCRYCRDANAGPLTIDHIFPRSRGGTNAMDNLATACMACNKDKDDLTIEEWEIKKSSGAMPPTPWRADRPRRSRAVRVKRGKYTPTSQAIAEAEILARHAINYDRMLLMAFRASEERKTKEEMARANKTRMTDEPTTTCLSLSTPPSSVDA